MANFTRDTGDVNIDASPVGDAPTPSLPDPDAVRGVVLNEQDYQDIRNGSTINIGLEVAAPDSPPR